MIALLAGVCFLDDMLERVPIEGTVWQRVFLGAETPPPGVLIMAVVLVLIALGARELCAIFRAKGVPTDPFLLALSGAIGCAVMYVIPPGFEARQAVVVVATLAGLLLLVALIRHSLGGDARGAASVAASAMFAMVYMGMMPGFFLVIRRWHSAWMVAAVMFIPKICDIGAYFTGRAIGRHKLIPWLSPGKTWEGLIGGVLLASAATAGLVIAGDRFGVTGTWDEPAGGRVFLQHGYPIWFALIAGAAMGLIGQFGDLAASLLKRDAGVKDSGGSVPGFGGVLDVVDSPIVVAPLAYWLLVFGALLGD